VRKSAIIRPVITNLNPFEPEPEERAKDFALLFDMGEKLMWSWLRNRRLGGYKFRRQHPFGECVLDSL